MYAVRESSYVTHKCVERHELHVVMRHCIIYKMKYQFVTHYVRKEFVTHECVARHTLHEIVRHCMKMENVV